MVPSLRALFALDRPGVAGVIGALSAIVAASATYPFGVAESTRPLAIGALTVALFVVILAGWNGLRHALGSPTDG